MYNKQKIEIVKDLNDINNMLKFCKETYTKINNENELLILNIPRYMCYQVYETRTKISLKCKYFSNKFIQYDFYLDGRESNMVNSALQCFSLLQKMSHKGVIDLTNSEYYLGTDNKGKISWSCGYNVGLLYTNRKYINIRNENVYSYDVNSSYAWAMIQDMPDTSVKPKLNCVPNKNEIGMSLTSLGNDDSQYLYIIENATDFDIECDYVFPKIESPFKHFVEYYYNKKLNSKNKEERQKYKDILNFSVGFIRRKNPFLHSAILSYARQRIMRLINKDTIYCNTDSIVSLKPRKDIEIGENVGQFKLEHENEMFAINKSGYQWNFEIPSIRGISKQWFTNGFDILKDTIPGSECNKYIYDPINEIITINTNYQED